MTMKKLSIILSVLSGIIYIQSQKVTWQKDFDSSSQDFLSAMTSTIDRQILLSGSSIKSNKPEAIGNKPNSGYDYHVLKLDQQGNKVWGKYFGGTRHDYLMSSVATREGGFLLAGTSYSNQSGDKKENNLGGSDVWIIRLNENGDELWQKTLGTKSNDEASSVVQSMDEGFFVTGNINSHKELFGSKDVFVSKLDKNGKLINTTILGGKGLDEVQEMIATKDGGSLIAIYSTSGKTENNVSGKQKEQNKNLIESKSGESKSSNSSNSSKRLNSSQNTATNILDLSISSSNKNGEPTTLNEQQGFGAGDFWVVKLDKNANVEWQKTFGGTEDDRPKTIANTQNGYIIAGESRSQSSGNKRENLKEGTDIWVINLDNDGNEIWQKNYSFGNRDVAMSLDVIRKTNKDHYSEDKGFLIGGYTQAEERIRRDDEKFWMLYLDTDGKEQWRKHITGKDKKKTERLVSAKFQNDGTYLLAGTSAEELGQENWKILKLGDKDFDDLVDNQNLKIYPNPVEDYCYVEIDFEFGEADIYLHDMSGRQLQTIKTRNAVTKINTQNLPQGVYIVTAKTEKKSVNAKIIKK